MADITEDLRAWIPGDPEDYAMTLMQKAAAEIEGLRRALGFAASVIKSGEPWTATCEAEIGALLKS